jgi:hypothetical protein
MTTSKEILIRDLAERILDAYYSSGKLIEDYSKNIVLKTLTKTEYDLLDEIAHGDF